MIGLIRFYIKILLYYHRRPKVSTPVGEVVEEKHSILSGGFSFVRIIFEDGNRRSFINDMDNECCCYYSGIRILH